ncbi:Hemicentin-1 [Trichoplax sp. H2]|nr:Hemicentin-1 [Trichoplax sp. H2]|eukprot:RDD47522.1 Hemicentin-1 [Trichoplax sp. H2]
MHLLWNLPVLFLLTVTPLHLDATEPSVPNTGSISSISTDSNRQYNITNIGRDFYLGYLESISSNSKPMLTISALHETAEVILTNYRENSKTTFQVKSNNTIELVLSKNIENTVKGLTNKTIRIQSDRDIVVTGVNSMPVSADNYLALPVESYGNEYIVVTYTPRRLAEFLIIAQNNQSVVNISFPSNTEYQGQHYSRSKLLIINLQQSEGFYFSSSTDLTGTIITSSSGIALFSGNECAFVTTGLKYCDHLVEQIPPIQYLGYNYVLNTFINRKAGDRFRVIAPYDNTDVFIQYNTLYYPLSRGSFVEFEVPSGNATLLTCSQPCLVVQFNKGYDADKVSTDPFMVIVPDVGQSLSQYRFYSTLHSQVSIRHHYINLVIETEHRHGLLLDGKLLSKINWKNVSIYSVSSINISAGSHYLNHSLSGVDYLLTIYGYNLYGSYGIPAGIRLSPLPDGLKIVLNPSSRDVVLGQNITLSCIAFGYPAPVTVSWFKNDLAITTDLSRQANSSGGYGRLFITNTSLQDAGYYSCRFSNSFGVKYSQAAKIAFTQSVFVQSPISQYVSKGQTVLLQCKIISSESTPEISWYKNDQEILRVLNDSGLAVLKLVNVSMSDAGRYVCRSQNKFGNATSGIAVIVVYYPPLVTEQPQNTTIIEGQTNQLTCAFTAYPVSSISWVKNINGIMQPIFTVPLIPDTINRVVDTKRAISQDVVDSSTQVVNPSINISTRNIRINNTYSKSILNIVNATRKDEGLYQCLAANVAGNGRSLWASVTIQAMPYITESPKSQNITEGADIILSCNGSGIPNPNVVWLKDSMNLSMGLLRTSFLNEKRILIIRNSTFQDRGFYQCSFENSVGRIVSENASINIYTTPRWISFPSDQIFFLGDNVTLSCDGTGYPFPSITWFRNGIEINNTARVKLANQQRMLIISNFSIHDASSYQCQLKNSAGRIRSPVATILNYNIPSLIDYPTSENVTQMRDIILSCNGTGYPYPKILWLKDGVMLNNSLSRYSILNQGKTLSIKNSTIYDRGSYQCQLVNIVGDITSPAAIIDIYTMPVFITYPYSYNINQGNNVTLSCNGTGNPDPNILWFKDGILLNNSLSRYSVLNRGKTLLIKNSTIYDRGPYQCHLVNIVGSIASPVALIDIYTMPVFNTFPHSHNVNLGNDILLSCNGSGNPLPRIEWLKDGAVLANLSSRGSYQCLLSNALGEMRSPVAFVDIYTLPQLIESPISQNLTQRNDMILHCNGTGNPLPNITWIKDGMPLKNWTFQYSLINKQQTLIIRNFTWNNRGSYQCLLKNLVGQIASPMAIVDFYAIPTFVNYTKSLSIPIGEAITLQCTGAGSPSPKIVWLQNDIQISTNQSFMTLLSNLNGYFVVSSTFSIELSTAQDSGVYRCTIMNSFGFSTSTGISITILEPPSPVGNISITNITARSFQISWLRPNFEGHTPITNYTVEILNQFNKSIPIALFCPTNSSFNDCIILSTSISINNLTPYALYYVKVIANNIVGASRSNLARIKTDQTAPGDSVSNIIGLGYNSTTIKIAWNPPSQSNGIVGYRLYQWNSYDLAMNQTNITSALVYAGNNTTYYATKLARDQVYYYQIISYNLKYHIDGPKSPVFNGSTHEDIPSSAPIHIVAISSSPTTLTLQWEPPPVKNRNGVILTYRIIYRSSLLNTTVSVQVDGSILSTLLRNLRPYTAYNITLAAATIVGYGPESPIVSESTMQAAPMQSPSIFNISLINNNTLKVEWLLLPTESIPGILEGFYLLLNNSKFGIMENRTVYVNQTVEQAGRRYLLAANLTYYSQYWISLQAFSAGGAGPSSVRYSIDTPVSVPSSSPQNINIVPGQFLATSAIISWAPPAVKYQNGIITKYKISYMIDNPLIVAKKPAVIVINDNVTQYMLENLIPVQNYTIQVAASTTVGFGPYSIPMIYQTRKSVSPSITLTPTNWTVDAGANISLQCSADGDPIPTVTWLKDNRTLIGKSYEKISGLSIHTKISILRATIADGGNYQCQFINYGGTAVTDAAVVHVWEPPIVSLFPRNQNITQGGSLQLTCYGYGYPPPVISWFKDGKQYNHPSRNWINGSEVQSMLIIHNISSLDEGYYKCQLNNSAGTATSQSSLITIYTYPSIIVSPVSQVVIEGNTVTLSCTGKGKPLPEISWLKNGLPLIRVQLIGELEESTIILPNSTIDDAGSYQCQLENLAGKVKSQAVTVTVHTFPSVFLSPVDVNATINQTITLNCNATGNPVPTIVWLKDGQPLLNSQGSGPQLIFNSLASDDEGIYQCRFSNVAGYALSDPSRLRVYSIPEFINYTSQLVISQGRTIQLHCIGSSIPKPTISWLRNGTILSSNLSSELILQAAEIKLYSSTLSIIKSQITDAGNYQCLISNLFTTSRSQNIPVVILVFIVKLNCNNELALPSPVSQIRSSNLSATGFTLHWTPPKFDGYTPITNYIIQLLNDRNQSVIHYNCQNRRIVDRCVVNSSLIVIDGLHPYSRYLIKVWAVNKIGESQSQEISIKTDETAPGDSVAKFLAIAYNSTCILLEWASPQAVNGVMEYRLYQWKQFYAEQTNSSDMIYLGPNTHYYSCGLQENQIYFFQTIPYNVKYHLDGPKSIIINATTEEDRPSSSPMNINAISTSPTSILLTWQPLNNLDRNGVILSYQIRYFHKAQMNSTKSISIHGQLTSFTLTGLRAYTTYFITMKAKTAVGFGPESPILTETTFQDAPNGKPQLKENLPISGDSVKVEWKAMPVDQIRGILQGFYYILNQINAGIRYNRSVAVNETLAAGDIRSFTISSLQYFTGYNISVQAYTIAGVGPLSDVRSFTTPESVPSGWPLISQIIPANSPSTSATVAWIPPESTSRNGILIKYKIKYALIDGQIIPDKETAITVGKVTRYTLTGLIPFNNYSIRVAASTSVGFGPDSPVVVYQTRKSVVPKVITYPESQLLQAGATITLECRANGEPIPTVNWVKNNQPIDQIYDISTASGYSNLTINKIAKADSGLYQCLFSNYAGSVRTIAANITVMDNDTLQFCPAEVANNLRWPKTSDGQVATINCPPPAQGLVTRLCQVSGNGLSIWQSIDTTGCISPVFSQISNLTSRLEANNTNQTEQAVETLDKAVTTDKKLYGGDLIIAKNAMKTINNVSTTVTVSLLIKSIVVNLQSNRFLIKFWYLDMLDRLQLRRLFSLPKLRTSFNSITAYFSLKHVGLHKKFVNISNSLLNLQNRDEWKNVQKSSSGSSSVMQSLEDFAGKLDLEPNSNKTTSITTENIVLQINQLAGSQASSDFQFPTNNTNDVDMAYDNIAVRVNLPKQIIQDNKVNKAVSIVFNTLAEILPSAGLNRSNDGNATAVINSKVFSMSIYPKLQKRFARSFLLLFNNNQQVKYSVLMVNTSSNNSRIRNLCSFWDFTSETGGWSDSGCKVGSESNALQTACYCDHLTTFATLLRRTEEEIAPGHRLALEIITFVGCGLSALGLLITIIVFAVLWRFLNNTKNVISMNLFVCLLVANLLILFGLPRTEIKPLCAVIAAALHYTLLASFFWMLHEGIFMYLMLVKVFDVSNKVAWCWLENEPPIFLAFIVPMLILVVVNCVLFGIALKAMLNTQKINQRKDDEQFLKLKAGLRAAIVLLPLLGVGWILGAVIIATDNIVFQYLFAIVNSLQGFVILIFQCLKNRQVLQAYRSMMKKRTRRESASSSTGRSRTKRMLSSWTTGSRSTISTGLSSEDNSAASKLRWKISIGEVLAGNKANKVRGSKPTELVQKNVRFIVEEKEMPSTMISNQNESTSIVDHDQEMPSTEISNRNESTSIVDHDQLLNSSVNQDSVEDSMPLQNSLSSDEEKHISTMELHATPHDSELNSVHEIDCNELQDLILQDERNNQLNVNSDEHEVTIKKDYSILLGEAPPLITFQAYWATIFARKSHTVIYLCPPDCTAIELWKEMELQKSGDLMIQLVSALNLNCYSIYDVRISLANQSVVHQVKIFQSAGWSTAENYNLADVHSAFEFLRQSWLDYASYADSKKPLLITSSEECLSKIIDQRTETDAVTGRSLAHEEHSKLNSTLVDLAIDEASATVAKDNHETGLQIVKGYLKGDRFLPYHMQQDTTIKGKLWGWMTKNKCRIVVSLCPSSELSQRNHLPFEIDDTNATITEVYHNGYYVVWQLMTSVSSVSLALL